MSTETDATVILKMLGRENALKTREMISPRMNLGAVSVALGWLKRRRLVEFDGHWRLTASGEIEYLANSSFNP